MLRRVAAGKRTSGRCSAQIASYPGIPPFEAEPVKIGEFCSKTPALPVSMQEQETEASRFLSALEKKHAQSRQQVADAISFGQYRKDGGSNV